MGRTLNFKLKVGFNYFFNLTDKDASLIRQRFQKIYQGFFDVVEAEEDEIESFVPLFKLLLYEFRNDSDDVWHYVIFLLGCQMEHGSLHLTGKLPPCEEGDIG